MSVVAGSETLGFPIPQSTQHAISVSLPAWRDNVGLRAGEGRVLDSLRSMYPRLWMYPHVRELANICKQKFGVDGEECMPFPSKRIADECRAFILDRTVLAGTPTQCIELHIAFFPANIYPVSMLFWRFTGLGISSRLAEHCLSLLRAQDEQGTEPSEGENKSSRNIIPSDGMSKGRGTYHETGYETSLAHNAGEFAKHALRRRVAGFIVTGNVQGGPQEPCTSAQNGASARGAQDVGEDDVYLFPTGMAAVWNAHQLCLRTRPKAKSVCLGFPYIDTLKVLEAWGPGVHFFGCGLDSDIDDLERLLAEESSRDPTKPSILALFVEFPSNPLLRSVDAPRLRALADMYDLLLVIDDTVGNFVNVEVLPYADIVVTSLTKIFSGAANVMGGSFVLNPKGRHYATLKSNMDIYEDTYFDEDALVMEHNSRDLVRRVRVIDDNTQAVSAFLRTRSVAGGVSSAVVKEVFYPEYTTPTHYLRCKRPEGGYGGLLSVTFTSLAASMAFFDALPCLKGPTIGTNFTLASPYTALALYGELEWAAQYGIEEGLVRISVGMEDQDWLLRSIDTALKAAESTL